MIQKIEKDIISNEKIDSFIVCGDPGCDGYNTFAVTIFEELLSYKGDFTMVVGDLVPVGTDRNWEMYIDLVNSNAVNPVYNLPGNHDIKNYEKYMGKKDYFMLFDDTIFIVLDNSKRYFSDETIEFLDKTISEQSFEKAFVFFHIPLPNPFILNNVIEEEWDKLRKSLDIIKDKIVTLFCGHVHSVMDFRIDGYRVIATGGAGSKFDEIESTSLRKNEHHGFEVKRINDEWKISIFDIQIENVKKVCEDEIVQNQLKTSIAGEAIAFRKYLYFSDIAEEEGYPGIAKLFRAASEAEYYHSQNMMIAAGEIGNTLSNLKYSLDNEKFESEEMYPEYIANAKLTKSKRAYNSFYSAFEAEKVHSKLFEEAIEAIKHNKDYNDEVYYTCTRCGFTHIGNRAPKFCPGCGADMFKFSKVK